MRSWSTTARCGHTVIPLAGSLSFNGPSQFWLAFSLRSSHPTARFILTVLYHSGSMSPSLRGAASGPTPVFRSSVCTVRKPSTVPTYRGSLLGLGPIVGRFAVLFRSSGASARTCLSRSLRPVVRFMDTVLLGYGSLSRIGPFGIRLARLWVPPPPGSGRRPRPSALPR